MDFKIHVLLGDIWCMRVLALEPVHILVVLKAFFIHLIQYIFDKSS